MFRALRSSSDGRVETLPSTGISYPRTSRMLRESKTPNLYTELFHRHVANPSRCPPSTMSGTSSDEDSKTTALPTELRWRSASHQLANCRNSRGLRRSQRALPTPFFIATARTRSPREAPRRPGFLRGGDGRPQPCSDAHPTCPPRGVPALRFHPMSRAARAGCRGPT